MTGRASREKGARGERDVCAKLHQHLGIKFCRNLKQYQQAQHGDIEPLAGPYLLEVKNQIRLCIPEWWRQSCKSADAKGALPCLVFKDKGKWWFMVPMKEANAPWHSDHLYTETLSLVGFCLRVRESL
jgi:hypothetical protein